MTDDTIAPAPDITELRRRIDAVRKIHHPVPEGGQGWLEDGSYGTIKPACMACGTYDEYAEPWPCATIRVLDGPGA